MGNGIVTSLCTRLLVVVFLAAAMLVGGCDSKILSTDLLGANLDLHHISISPASPPAGDNITFTVNYSNRSDKVREFICRIKPGGYRAKIAAMPQTEDFDAELEWPALSPGRYRISCGALTEKGSTAIFSLSRDFEVGSAVLAEKTRSGASEAMDDGQGGRFSLRDMTVLENQRVWSGKLRLRVRFDNPHRTGGWIRCATAPLADGEQLAKITRERRGERIFEFTYPENITAEYYAWCTTGRLFLNGPRLRTGPFKVGL